MSSFNNDDWTIGDSGFYVLPKSRANGRHADLYLAISVINVTDDRVVVKPSAGRGGHRILKASSLVKTAPAGAWIK